MKYTLGVIGLIWVSHAQAEDMKIFNTHSQNTSIACSKLELPPKAIRKIPKPFSAYLKLTCQKLTGQGLAPPKGFNWVEIRSGYGMNFSSTSQKAMESMSNGGSALAWYTQLEPQAISSDARNAIIAGLNKALPAKRFDDTAMIALKASTSFDEEKLITIVVPSLETVPPPAAVLLECFGPCFTTDTAPMILFGKPD